ncbi:hypothetical protein [Ruthenibacterium lactatiformans]|uniref:hypothetical protein n=1 Tax=Ruthenibacterium lactatiformans TaxID=1550024 RepID=UPI002672481D|nr:hypothetical protein [Ruthenibacterium lactatiformans]
MQTLEEKQQDGMTGAGPETEFHTELFGFNRVEVLSYIERISAANAEKARALEDTIAALQKDLTGVRRQGSTLAQKAKQVFNELENQKKRAEDAVAEAAALRTEVDKANDEIAAVRSRLFAREQENAALKSDNARLSETVDDLTRALTRRGAPLPAGQNASASGSSGDQALLQQAQLKARDILRAADAQATAHIEKAKEDAAAIVAQAKVEKSKAKAGLAESADGIAASIAVLKAQLAAVDAKILAATGDLQKATDGITAALGNTERSLSSLGAQVERFPENAPAAQPQPAQPAAPPAPQEPAPAREYAVQEHAAYPVREGRSVRDGAVPAFVPDSEYDRYVRARREEDAYYSALRRVRYEDELRDRFYEEERLRQEALRRIRYDEALREQEYARRCGPDHRAPYAAAPEGGYPLYASRRDDRFDRAPALGRDGGAAVVQAREADLPQTAAAGRHAAVQQPMAPMPSSVPPAAEEPQQELQPPAFEASRPRYRATNGRPLPGRNVTPQGDRPAVLEEQYDAVQHAARGGAPGNAPYDIPEAPAQPVVQKVEIPQVPPKEPPESGSQIPFGKPHAPRAMPFAPFDPYTPHTAPYIEPDAEAARILNTPPPPPPRGTEAKQPYVPQPTPIAPSVPLSGPYARPSAAAVAGTPQAQPAPARTEEPVIIPYSAPIPPMGSKADAGEAAAASAARKGEASPAAPVSGQKKPEMQRAQEPSAPSVGAAAKPPVFTAPRGQQKQGSALSDDLLANLNALLNGGQEP